MQQLYHDKDGFLSEPPNVASYNIVIDAWTKQVGSGSSTPTSRKRDLDMAHRAHEWMERMKVAGIQPNTITYNTVITAYSRAGQPFGRAQMADDFLEACLSEYDATKDPQMRPTVVTFTAILNAWSKAKGFPEAARKAHRLLLRMEEQYGIRPNAFSYSAVLDAYARSTLPDAADKALCLFHDMRDQRSSRLDIGESQELPAIRCNRIMYNTVINAWANQGNFSKANDLYRELLEKSKVNTSLAPPDEWTYRALWKAIIKSNQIGPQEKLNRMQKLMQLMTDSGLDLSNHMQDDIERIRQQQP
eukprot:jgi/Psemu1/228791/e_gw1.2476.3.1